MRKLAMFLGAAMLAPPALAQDRYAPPPRDDLHDAARALGDPRTQASIAGLVDSLTDAVMATRVGPLADLVPESDVRRSDTLDDIQRRRDPNYRARLHRDTMGAVAVAGRAARDSAALSDELGATVARLERVIDGYKR